MESAGDNVGSFEYQDKAGKVKLSPSIWHLLDIRPDRRKPVGEMDYGQWQDILGRMERIHELEDGIPLWTRAATGGPCPSGRGPRKTA